MQVGKAKISILNECLALQSITVSTWLYIAPVVGFVGRPMRVSAHQALRGVALGGPILSPRLPSGRSRDCGVNSNVNVCEKAKHHTELFWYKLYKFIFVTHSLGILYSRFSRYNNSDEVANLADRLDRPAPTMTTF